MSCSTTRPVSFLLAALAAVALGAGGCGLETSDAAPEGSVDVRVEGTTSEPSIFGGSADDDADAIGAVVALRVGEGPSFELCSGALLSPSIVLTARHCVTKSVTTAVSCDARGRSVNGPHVASDEKPSKVSVYVGARPRFSGPASSVGRVIVAPSGPYLCDADIALLVLETPITAAKPLRVRMHSAARVGENIRAIGYGKNDVSSPIGTRFRKSDVPVLAQGSAVSPSKTPLGAHEFEVGKSICQGDSGGPAISEETGAVLGVVSRGNGCDEDFGHIYTTTAGFEELFAQAFALTGDAPSLEDETAPIAYARSGEGAPQLPDDESNAPLAGCSLVRDGAVGSCGGSAAAVVALAAVAARRRRTLR